MTLWHGNFFHITGPMWGESTRHRGIPLSSGHNCGALMFSFMLARTKFWIAGDFRRHQKIHYSGVIMGAMASQITSLRIVNSTVYSGVDQRKHQESASLASVRGIHWWPVNFPAQMATNAENVSIWWRHHGYSSFQHMSVMWMCQWVTTIWRAWTPTLGLSWHLHPRVHLRLAGFYTTWNKSFPQTLTDVMYTLTWWVLVIFI